MPAISMFYGIIIYMYSEKGSRHSKPHFHACYQNAEIVMTFGGIILEGSMPKAKLKLIDAWIELHKDELYAN